MSGEVLMVTELAGMDPKDRYVVEGSGEWLRVLRRGMIGWDGFWLTGFWARCVFVLRVLMS